MRRAAAVFPWLATAVFTAGAAQAQVPDRGPGAAREALRNVGSDPSPLVFWRELGDPTLEQLIAEALGANHDLRAVVAHVRSVEAARMEAALDLAPRVTSSAGYSRQRLATATIPGANGRLPDQDVWEAGLRMSWEVDAFGRQRSRLRAHDARVGSAEADAGDVEIRLAAEVARAVFDLRGAEARLEVARRNADNQRSTLELTHDRLELGHGSALDTERAQAQLSSTLASIPTIEAEAAAIEHRLAVLLGRTPGGPASDIVGESRSASMPAALYPTDPDELVLRRPDVRAAERDVATRRALVAEARAGYLPRISIDAVAGYTADAFDALGSSGTPRYAVGPVVSWAFLDLGRVKTRVDQARADASFASDRYAQALLGAREEVASSLAAYRGAQERLRHLEAAAGASERATEIARLRFEEGATGFLEVLDAERTLLEAQDRLAAGRRDAAGALVAVYRATGGQVSTSPERAR